MVLSRVLPALVLTLIIPAAAHAAEVAGVWRGEVVLPTGQALPFVARLTQEGTTVSGTLDGIGGGPDVQIVNGRSEGDTVTFSGVRDVNGMPVRFNYTGAVVDADTLDFTIVREDGAQAPLRSVVKRDRVP